ncbi:hypothetical protein [Falsiroseomonas sp.]|uniref:hypothetical protein n=1 Tax=Falsiroseomonas sp. TaxID=2870721 RepID=UPI0035643E69
MQAPHALLAGDVTALLSGNTDDVVALRDAVRGTDLEAYYLNLGEPEGASDRTRPVTVLPFAVEDTVAVVADIEGTGIKAGHVGLVTFVQRRGREIGHSTDLAHTAYLVRFGGGAEIWMTAEELAPAPGQRLTKGGPMQSPRERRVLSRIRFRDGMAEGWAFGITEGFKAALDIAPTPRALSGRSSQGGEPLVAELKARGIEVSEEAIAGQGHALAHLATSLQEAGIAATDFTMKRLARGDMRVFVTLETQGSPPAYCFAAGDTMHEPPSVHRLPWRQGQLILRRSVQVDDAAPDRAPEGLEDAGRPGTVRASIRRYSEGELVATRQVSCSQAELVRLLRDGVEPHAPVEADSDQPLAVEQMSLAI